MDRLKQLKTYPSGLLLWLEWILLGSALLADLPSSYAWIKYDNPDTSSVWLGFILSLLCMLALGMMGLRFPQKKRSKWLYFWVQIALIWLPTIHNHKIDLSFFLCLIVAMRNGLIFESRECKLANVILFLSFIPSMLFYTDYGEFKASIARYQAITSLEFQQNIGTGIVSILVKLASCILFCWVLVNILLKEHQSQQQLEIAREQLRQYALQAEDRATVQERNRIAREIHDSLGHALTAQSIQLHNAIAFWQSDPTKAYQFLLESQSLVKTALKDIRHSVSTLRRDPLQGKKLEAAIFLLCQNFSSRTNVMPNFSFVLDRPLTEEIKLTVYRIVQEALTNISKHSQPTVVNLKVRTFAEFLHLFIEDNGRGFNPEQNTAGFGLQGMRERVIALDGDLKIDSSLGCGCTITISIPLERSL
ncbi:MAG: sensor histidine kinase [Cyanobacteria bacterium P01_G01_bin.39]